MVDMTTLPNQNITVHKMVNQQNVSIICCCIVKQTQNLTLICFAFVLLNQIDDRLETRINYRNLISNLQSELNNLLAS